MPFTDADVLSYNPWGFDESDYRVLRNGMVVTRKAATCALCFEPIQVGTRVRSQGEIFEGHAKTFKFCPLCCEAMGKASSGEDMDGALVETRMEMGQRNAKEQQPPRAGG